MRMASISSRASMIAATGPKISSSCAGRPGFTSLSTVGGDHAPAVRNFASAQKERAFGDALLNLFVNAVTALR